MVAEIKVVIITVSDACAAGTRADDSGAALVELLRDAGAEVVAQEVVSDELGPLTERLRVLAARADVNLVLTTGGTGLGPRDNTPEATRAVLEREVPGLCELMRAETSKQTPTAFLSRAACGTRSGALLVNLPGSPKAVRECFAVIRPVLAHAVAQLAGRDHEEK